MVSESVSLTTLHRPLRLGFVALADCAPLAVAQETGIFERHGLSVELYREPEWISVRDKIYQGKLDAAQAIAGIAFALSFGVGGMRRDIAVPLVLNQHGNAVTLGREIDPEVFREEGLKRYLRHRWRKDRPFTMAVAHRFSSHHVLLNQWLSMQGLDPSEDVNLVFVPSSKVPGQLKAGEIDGFCVAEPWNSVAVLEGTGWCPAISSELSHGHPEKVLLVSGRLHDEYREASLRLVGALVEACRVCQDKSFRSELIDILALSKYTGASREVLENSFGTQFNAGPRIVRTDSFHVFHGPGVNAPSVDKASWILSGLQQAGALPDVPGGPLTRIYREDVYKAAVAMTG